MVFSALPQNLQDSPAEEASRRRSVMSMPKSNTAHLLAKPMNRPSPRGTPRSGHTWTPKMRPTKHRHGKAITAVRTLKEGSTSSLGDAVPKPPGFNAFGQNCPNQLPCTSPAAANLTEALNYPPPIGRVHGVHVWPDFRCPLRPSLYSNQPAHSDARMRARKITEHTTRISKVKSISDLNIDLPRLCIVRAAERRAVVHQESAVPQI